MALYTVKDLTEKTGLSTATVRNRLNAYAGYPVSVRSGAKGRPAYVYDIGANILKQMFKTKKEGK